MGNNELFIRNISWVIKLQILFFAMSILLLGLDFIFRESINEFVWLRSGGLAILSFIFIKFGLKLRERKRSAYIRVMIISIAGALGIYALAISGGDVYPLWMRIEQGIQGLLLIMIIIIIQKNRSFFLKGNCR